jgi:hypothetical protein
MSLSPPENYDLLEIFPLKSYSILTGNKVLDAHASNTDGFLSRDTSFSST